MFPYSPKPLKAPKKFMSTNDMTFVETLQKLEHEKFRNLKFRWGTSIHPDPLKGLQFGFCQPFEQSK